MIKFLEYKDRKLPIRTNWYALKMTKEKLGRAIKIGDGVDFEGYETLLFYSLKRGYKLAGEDFTWKPGDMEDLLDYVYNQFEAILPDFFDVKKDKEGETPGKKRIRET